MPAGITSMAGRIYMMVPMSRRGLRIGDVDRRGRRVIQICPNLECLRDWHRARPQCRHCGTALAPPWAVATAGAGAYRFDAAGDPMDEVEPDPELEGEGPIPVHLARWIWLAGALTQLRRVETRMQQMAIRLLQDTAAAAAVAVAAVAAA